MIKQILKEQKEIDLFLEQLVNSEKITLDIETTYFSEKNFSCQHLDLEGIGLYNGTIGGYIVHSEGIDYSGLDQILHNTKVILHNGLFDLQILLRLNKISDLDSLDIEDTKILSFLDNENRFTHGLKYLAEHILGKKDVVQFNDVGEKPFGATELNAWIEKIGSYCIDDCVNTFELFEYFQREIKDKKILEAYKNVEIPLMKVLIEMANFGIKLDSEYLKGVGEKVGDKLLELQIEVYKEIGGVIDLGNLEQIKEILLKEFKKKDISIGEGLKMSDMVNYGLKNDIKIAFLIKEYREFLKLENTYIDSILKKEINGKIYPEFSQVKIVTGRLSCSNPSLQQIPSRDDFYNIRKAFISEEGSSFLIADINQAELRILSHFSQEPLLIESLIKGEDIHQITADTLKITRKEAKQVTFGILYGITEYGLSEQLGIEKEEAKKMIKDYFIKFPKVKELKDTLIKLAKERGFIKTISGRRRHFLSELDEQKNEEIKENQVLNSLIQGSVADLMKMIMIGIQKEIKKYGASILMQIHDELVIQCPDLHLEEVKEIVNDKMQNSFAFTYVNIVNSLKVSKYWIK